MLAENLEQISKLYETTENDVKNFYEATSQTTFWDRFMEKFLSGAAVTTVMGPVALPGVVIVAASSIVIQGVDAGINALTGKTTTEWISVVDKNIWQAGLRCIFCSGTWRAIYIYDSDSGSCNCIYKRSYRKQ